MSPQELAEAQAALTNAWAFDSQWIPALAGILGALVGSIATFIPNLIVESRRNRKESKLVEASLIAEMTALVEIAEERRFLPSLELVISHLENQPAGSKSFLSANIPLHYSRVYQANVHRIGIVEQTKATDIIRFYQLIDAIVQDISEGGVLSEGGTIDAFRENHRILTRAFEISRRYQART